MDNMEKYKEAFAEGLGIAIEDAENAEFEKSPEWDSVGHMRLIAALEDAFDIVFDTEDIVILSSFAVGREILKKYEVEV